MRLALQRKARKPRCLLVGPRAHPDRCPLPPPLCRLDIVCGGPLLVGPPAAAAAQPPPGRQLPCPWLPARLTSLTIGSVGAAASLAACCDGLAAALPALRELRLPVFAGEHDTELG